MKLASQNELMNPRLKFEILTLFPKFFESPLQQSIINRTIKNKIIQINTRDIRNYASDKHKTVDDKPFGGGEGMVLKVDTLVSALDDIDKKQKSHVILLDPRGKKFNQRYAESLTKKTNIILVCGHYEGVDQRFAENWADEILSIGDYVLGGGESAALVIIDSVTRLLPGALGNEKSAKRDSFSEHKTSENKTTRILKHPVYTRPKVFRGKKVPSVLLSGDHYKIKAWREEKSLETTKKTRPDLL